jgi:hypothetical protein
MSDLLHDLINERYANNLWWTKKPPAPPVDDELTCRRRLAECVREAEEPARDRRAGAA